jgi:hypothetical protein
MVRIQRLNVPVLWLVMAVVALLLVVAVLFIFGGGMGGASFSSYGDTLAALQPQQGQQAQPGFAAQDVDSRGLANEPQSVNQVAATGLEGRIIIRNASLRIVVEDPRLALIEVATLADEFGGWVVNSSANSVTTASGVETARAAITIRVMAERLDEALTTIKDGALSVESEAVTGQDVTQQYVDLTSRLRNLQAAETQLQSILEEARRTEDVLSVYNQLVSIRGEIETLQGQIQYYDESAAFSSISVELIPQALETPIQIAGWSPEGTARTAFVALLNVLRFLVDAAITLVVLVLPLVLIVGIPGRWVYRRLRSRRPAVESPAEG